MLNTVRINRALDAIHQVQQVNVLIQGICSRIPTAELSANEAQGLWVVLEWQNKNLEEAGAVIETIA